MKTLLATLILLMTNLVYASDPYDMCQHPGQCSVAQNKMYKKFQSCLGYMPEVTSERVYSGHCYHNSKVYSNKDAHYGVMYFSSINNDARFGGSFGFYQKVNPYKDLSSVQASIKYAKLINKKSHTLDISGGVYGHVFWDGERAENTIGYWFKTCEDKVYLQGAWGPEHQFICEFSAND